MIKNAFNKNKGSFICFSIVFALLFIAFILSLIPLQHYITILSFSNVYLAILIATMLLFATLFIDNKHFAHLLKIFAYVILTIVNVNNLFSNAIIGSYFSTRFFLGHLPLLISMVIWVVVCVLLLIGQIKRLSQKFMFFSSLSYIIGVILYCVILFMGAVDVFSVVGSVFPALLELVFFIGNALLSTPFEKRDELLRETSITKKLCELNRLYKQGKITQEDYESQRIEALKNI